MLVLSRKVGQEIVINGNIHIRILSCSKSQIRLGIIAPQDVPVDRQEVAEVRKRYRDQMQSEASQLEMAESPL